jgi:hypothetical protein
VKKKKFHFDGWIFMLILISGLLYLPSCRFLEQQGFFRRKSLRDALLWAKQDSARVADSLKRIAVVKNSGEEIILDSLQKNMNEKPSVKRVNSNYHIIVGSFTNAENSRLRARDYFSKGYITDIILTTGRNGNKIELVSVRSFENNDDAKKFLTDFQRDVDSTAWIYSKN